MRLIPIYICAFTVLFMAAMPMLAFADQLPKIREARQQFLVDALHNPVPTPKVLWLDSDVKKDMKKILKHDYAGLRVRYWQESSQRDKAVRRVWILDEIGKYKPITVGIVIRDGAIEKLQVLAYRESHGWEVKYDFFTHQFIGATLPKHWKLDRRIDGISGATLSVRALKKIAMLSLYLDGVASQKTTLSQNLKP